MKIVSIVTIAVCKNGEFLLIKDNKRDFWKFPSDKFNGNLNGNIDDTVKRILNNFIEYDNGAEYLGSFLRKEKKRVLIGYNFLVENFEGEVLPKTYKWLTKEDMAKIKLDKNTAIFLKLHNDIL